MNSPALPDRVDHLVIGAGLAGLAAARTLRSAGASVHVVEAGDAVGGRVRTDEVEGFRLDRGFQVMLTAYEELQDQVKLSELDLRRFRPGSLIWTGNALEKLGDPWRDPASAFASLRADVGSMGDKLKVAALRRELLGKDPEELFRGPDRTTLEELDDRGFSRSFIDAFFRPFLGGVFLERELATSSRLFQYYFRCFSDGDAAVPAGGMQRLPEALARGLDDAITLEAPVAEIRPGGITLEDGTAVASDSIIVAVDGTSAARLLERDPVPCKATVTSYFVAGSPPVKDPLLVLDGEGTGPVNHLAVMTNVAPGYARAEGHLVSVSAVGEDAADPETFAGAARSQMTRWFGEEVAGWRHLRTYHIPHALPEHPGGSFEPGDHVESPCPGMIVAGDHVGFGSLQGALKSGRLAAEWALRDG